MKKIYFGSNLKMYKNIQETVDYLTALERLTGDICNEDLELFIIPSYTALERSVKSVHNIRIGAQNMCWEEKGQFTGEISPLMLKEVGVHLVMVGHSERRHVFGETDLEENKKVLAGMDHGMTVLLCVGETAEEKMYGISKEILRRQLLEGLHGVSSEMTENIWIAYEPVWSIGVNGTPASPEYAKEMHLVIRECLKELFGDASKKIPILYGGSVNLENANELIRQEAVDGLFVGRSAWQAKQFDLLIRNALQCVRTF